MVIESTIAPSYAVHETFARFWENHVFRTLPFMTWLLPFLQKKFPGRFDKVTPIELLRAFSSERPTLVRVAAGEFTYHLHTWVRFHIESEMMSGALKVEDLPERYAELIVEHFGVKPMGFADGAGVDVHWGRLNIGYFPQYSLASAAAAQLNMAFEQTCPDWTGHVARGDFSLHNTWLENIAYPLAPALNLSEFVEYATGKTLDPQCWIEYLERKVHAVWDGQ